MRIWGITDIGLVRRENQDAYAFQAGDGCMVCVVCDGMGGPAGGRLASATAIQVYMAQCVEALRPGMGAEELREVSRRAVNMANSAIRAAAERSPLDYGGMGTTLVSALSSGEGVVITNVGDSRAYYLTEDTIALITRDHSLVQSLVERGDITPEEARVHPNRNVITRALGPDEEVECDIFYCSLKSGSALLLCTDGLINTVTDQEILREVQCGRDGKSLSALLSIARSRGAPDNVTAVLIENL